MLESMMHDKDIHQKYYIQVSMTLALRACRAVAAFNSIS